MYIYIHTYIHRYIHTYIWYFPPIQEPGLQQLGFLSYLLGFPVTSCQVRAISAYGPRAVELCVWYPDVPSRGWVARLRFTGFTGRSRSAPFKTLSSRPERPQPIQVAKGVSTERDRPRVLMGEIWEMKTGGFLQWIYPRKPRFQWEIWVFLGNLGFLESLDISNLCGSPNGTKWGGMEFWEQCLEQRVWGVLNPYSAKLYRAQGAAWSTASQLPGMYLPQKD